MNSELKVGAVVSIKADLPVEEYGDYWTAARIASELSLKDFNDEAKLGMVYEVGIHSSLRDPELERLTSEIENARQILINALNGQEIKGKPISEMSLETLIAAIVYDRNNSNRLVDELRHERIVLQQLRADDFKDRVLLEADSVRYNWLKKHARKIEWRISDETRWLTSRPELDADIDAAIERGKL